MDFGCLRLICLAVCFLSPTSVQLVASQQANLVCQIENPNRIRDCRVLRECLFNVFPVEAVLGCSDGQDSPLNTCGRINNLFALYEGTTACQYFGNFIKTEHGRNALVSVVQQQLKKSSFRGIFLQCDPTVDGVDQMAYNSILQLLRKQLGNGYIIAVKIENPKLEPCVIETLNELIDLISCPQEDNSIPPKATVQDLLSSGLQAQKILADVPFPAPLTCPLCDVHLRVASDFIKLNNIFGATIELDHDDVDNKCGNGTFPLMRRLTSLLADDGLCEFEGFIPDPRDRSRFYSCSNGKYNLHQCPKGQLFDRRNETCIPFVQMHCNETFCTVIGPIGMVNNQTELIAVPVFVPGANITLNSGSGSGDSNTNGTGDGSMGSMDGSGDMNDSNGMNGTSGTNGTDSMSGGDGAGTIIFNRTDIIIGGPDSELLKLLNRTGLEQTVGVLNNGLKNVYPPLKDLVDTVNSLVGPLLNGANMMDATGQSMDELAKKLGLLESIIQVVLKLLKNALGLDLTGLLGGAAGAPAAAGGAAGGGAAAGLGGVLGGLLGGLG
ncbi:uncharacterized protein LOC129743426 [Uranotaenia lowii]|uniref:uncharacterized protein LOC129743426 n=1 Tax=Uranotaenia lowii TaxID=190385 RepID=UPI002478B08A|nr:uncharacterized protein LOC129743426 [Uranotaenia lowii]